MHLFYQNKAGFHKRIPMQRFAVCKPFGDLFKKNKSKNKKGCEKLYLYIISNLHLTTYLMERRI